MTAYQRSVILAVAPTIRNIPRAVHSWVLGTNGAYIKQESCAITKITARCDDKSKQTATPPPKIT